jgi:hypothetical protein
MTYTPSPDRYGRMIYNRCGKSGLKLPAVSLGLWHNWGDTTDFEHARKMTFMIIAMNWSFPPKLVGTCGRGLTAISDRGNI